MKKILPILAILMATGCLDRGDPVVLAQDLRSPTIVSTTPMTDGTIAPEAAIEIIFSKTMDPHSLVPGISLFRNNQEIPLSLTAPPPPNLPLAVIQTDQPYTVRAQPSSGRLQPTAGYVLLLRKVLSDAWGNGLPVDIQIPFRTTL